MSFPERYLEVAKSAFGDGREPIGTIAHRAHELFDRPVIVWEGDAQTFAFSFVSESTEAILGHPARRWTAEPTFWADSVVHPDDRDDAVGYCALATGKCLDHAFVYRAKTADGVVRWLADYVQVIRPTRCRRATAWDHDRHHRRHWCRDEREIMALPGAGRRRGRHLLLTRSGSSLTPPSLRGTLLRA